MSSLKKHIEEFEENLLDEINALNEISDSKKFEIQMSNVTALQENVAKFDEQFEDTLLDESDFNAKYNSNDAFGLRTINEQHKYELDEKDKIIENLKQKLESNWMENKLALNTKKMYEDKIKKMDIVDSTQLIPTLIQVSRQKQGRRKLDWNSWLEIPESSYLFQINESLAKKVFQEANRSVSIKEEAHSPRRSRSTVVVPPKPYALTFAADGATDYVRTTFNPDNYDGTETGLNNGFTVSFWIKPNEIGGFRQALGRRSEYNGYFNFGIKSATAIHVGIGARATLKTGNTHNDGVEMGHGMEVGNWYHWVVTYAGDENVGGDELVHMWINGKEITKFEAAGGDGLENGMGTANWEPDWTNTVNGAENLYFGARTEHQGLPTPYTQGWACSLSEVAIYKDEKEKGTFANEVYNAGWGYDHRNNSNLVGYWRLNEGSGETVTDLSGNDNHGTLTTNGTEIPTWTKYGSYE